MAVRILLSRLGQRIKFFSFDQLIITCGHHPANDIAVEADDVAEVQFRLFRRNDGLYQLVDGDHTLATHINAWPTTGAPVQHNDVIRFGRHTLWVLYERERVE